jgi:hypothetical protein
MNMKISEEFGGYFARIPLKATPHIVCANALQTDWATVLPPERCSFVLGNPPFLGKSNQSAAQKADMQLVCGDIKNAGLLDFVAAWYIKAARYMRSLPSPSQGEGVYAVPLSPPTASRKGSKLAYCGVGCWHKVSRFTLRTALLAGITKRAVKRLCIV